MRKESLAPTNMDSMHSTYWVEATFKKMFVSDFKAVTEKIHYQEGGNIFLSFINN